MAFSEANVSTYKRMVTISFFKRLFIRQAFKYGPQLAHI